MGARVAATFLVLTLLVACTGQQAERDGWDEAPGTVALASALRAFDACDDLLEYVVEHALDMVGPWGLGGGGWPEMAVEEEAADDDGAAAPVEGVDYSGTNVQEAGVDEPDTVKSDGRRLYLVRGEQLHIVDVTGEAPSLLTSVDLGGWGGQLLRAGDRLLVLGASEGVVRPMADAAVPWQSGARLQLFDVADPARPVRVATLHLDGWVVSARLVNGVARVVLRAEPVGLPFVSPEGSGIRAEREATERNREVVRDSTVENWVPYFVQEAGGREREGTLVPCERMHRPDTFAGLGTTSVLSLDLDGDLAPEGSTGVLAGGEEVYASPERLYVATNRWFDWAALGEDEARAADETYTTELHAFDITDERSARYVGSGSVRGHVLDQWGLSAHEGVLRVATTEGSPWWGPARGRDEPQSESFVTTFAERDDTLVQLGQVGGLGLDERIYAVRFIGDLGYVVTFRETDPLYTVDLSDPADPRVLGELKITGYSAYLHPVGERLLLGVGQDADERGVTQGLQLSLFDVSDAANPTRLHQVTLADAHSGVEWDHHAFLHWPATGLTIVPFETWHWDEETETEEVDSGALGYRLDRDTGFVEVERMTHLPDELRDPAHPRYWDVAWRAPIRRSVVVDDALYTVSELGVMASDLDTLAERAWLDLPQR